MKVISKILPGVFVLIIYCSVFFSASSAGPVVHCDSPNVNVGSIREGTIKRIRHVFTLKNTGNEPLRLTRVKPG